MLFPFIFVGIIMITLILIIKSHALMNYLTQIYTLLIIAAASYGLTSLSLPYYFSSNQYFFVDALSLYEILITGILFWLASVYTKGYTQSLINKGELHDKNVKLFYVVFNALFISLILAFSSNNLALLWIFAELTTLFCAILIVILNAKQNIVAAMKYVFITSTAMIFSFFGLIILFALGKQSIGQTTLNLDIFMQHAHTFSPNLFILSLTFLFIGFAAKAGIVPFHSWLPQAYAKAPSTVSVILSGSVSGIGIYALIRFLSLAKLQSSVFSFFSLLLLLFGIATLIIASFSMVTRRSLKKLIAYSSIEGTGLLLIGLGVGSATGLYWVLVLLLVHPLIKGLLFFSAGIIHQQYDSIKAQSIYSLLTFQPLAGWGLLLGSIALIGTPLFPLFLPKLLILSELAKISLFLFIMVLFFFLMVAGAFVIFMLQLLREKETGTVLGYTAPLSMKLPVLFLIIIILLLGVFMPEQFQLLLHNIIVSLGW